ncbi:glucan endo-1,3-beta-glucosidase 12-like isoform X2 [Canna indica]|uniref:Glucan endo-1,3-beta-glucosidase 12-like isoform X2 n=1 Tax=Canna indica TaxID=4628 RepID=A0AAQ3L957_9LILI|nr:glucan endo-1,3-beta-glucosidase 12-like isoform X2 [Canna indica]
MGVNVVRCLVFLLGLLFSLGVLAKEAEDDLSSSPSLMQTAKSNKECIWQKSLAYESKKNISRVLHGGIKVQASVQERDIVTPITTVPVINPTTTPDYNAFPTISNPTTPTMTPATDPYSTPTMTTPSSAAAAAGKSWCVASQTASQTALQVGLDYACGYGGADCSAIQNGGSCYNPDTVRDHASYAFNNYYQKNPNPTSCDFGGTAVITNVDPSSSTCQYPSTSTSSSVLNTKSPTGSGVFGFVPPATSGSTLMLQNIITFTCLHMLLIFLSVWK